MPNDSPSDNRVYCKAYYERLKSNPLKWQAFLEKRSQYKKTRKPVNLTCEPPVNPIAVSPEKTSKTACEPYTPKKSVTKEEFDALYEERAAIKEYDGNLPRETAETSAMEELLKRLVVE